MMSQEQLAWLKNELGFDTDAAAPAAVEAAPGAPEPPRGGAPEPPPPIGIPQPPAAPPPAQGPTPTLYLKEAGDKGEIADTDINQGTIGDCYLLSSIGEIARISPATIKSMIKDNGNGTYTVTLHKKDNGFWAGVKSVFGADPTFSPVLVTVTADFPASGSVNAQPGQDTAGGKKEIWPQIIEKAYAQLHGGYSKIKDGGDPADALGELTGQAATSKGPSGVGLKELQEAFKAGKPIVMNTPEKKGLPYNLVPGHAYMLEDIVVDPKGGASIKLRNPWGTTQIQPPQLIPFDKLSNGIDSVDIGGALPQQKS